METYLRDLMTDQIRAGLHSSALVHQTSISLRSATENYTRRNVSLFITRAAVWARTLFTPFSPTFPLLLRRLIKSEQPDILHLHLPNVSAFWVLLIPAASKIPWLVHWHADVLPSRYSLGLRFFYSLYRLIERSLLRRCAAIIVTSPPYLASSPALGDFIDKSFVVPLGLDASRMPRSEVPRERSGTAGLFRVLAVGRLTYYKGFAWLIRATAMSENLELHLVGIGREEAKLRKLVREFGLEQRVIFHGQLSDSQLLRQFEDCDCVCVPSVERTEAFGVVLLEAMHHGKPVVISDVPGSGMGWVVDEDVTGLKVPPRNSAALEQALRQLAADRERCGVLGEHGRLKFDEYFHIEQSTRRISAIYRQILDQTRIP